MAARFQGIPVEAFEFYEALAAENTKTWWTAHKATYDTAVRGPMEDLLADLADEFGEGRMFRPYNDVRFSKDKTPYKVHQGAYVPTEDGIGYYVQVSASGLMVAGGWWSPSPKQVARYRDAVDGATGAVLEKAIAAAEKAGLTLGGDVMKTRPRGIAEDHPRIELLRHRTLTVERHDGSPAWVSTRKAITHVQKQWRAMTPLVDWLTDHVGPEDDGIPPEPR
jgi:uncharacterized protein (TIGR02453 family)